MSVILFVILMLLIMNSVNNLGIPMSLIIVGGIALICSLGFAGILAIASVIGIFILVKEIFQWIKKKYSELV